MATERKYVSLEKLGLYDGKIKKVISDGDAATLAAAVKAAEDLGSNYDPAGSAATAEANAIAHADGKDAAIATAKKAGDDAAAAAGVADGKAVAAQAAADAVAAKVGTVPEGSTVMGIIDQIQENAYDDTELRGLISGLDTNKADKTQVATDIGAAKTELEGKISTAQAKADGAQTHSEGVAADLAEAVEALEGVDAGQETRIASLEDQILGLSGAMHFKGVKEELPTDGTGYEQGDVIIVGNKEYVLNGNAFVEFGDATVNAEAITLLTGRMDTAEGAIEEAQGDITALEGAVATKAETTALETAVEALEEADAGQIERIAALEGKFAGEGSVEDMIADAKAEAIATAGTNADTKDAEILAQAKNYADDEDAKIEARVDALEADTHTHANKTLLDTYTQTEADLADAVAKKHEHANAAVLAGISSEKVAAWDKIGDAATQTDLNTAKDRITAVEESIGSFTECSETDINNLFQQ